MGSPKKLIVTNGTFNGPQKMLDAPLCMEFRSGARGSSEIIQIKAKMKVGWKFLNSQRQAKKKVKNRIFFPFRPGPGPAQRSRHTCILMTWNFLNELDFSKGLEFSKDLEFSQGPGIFSTGEQAPK